MPSSSEEDIFFEPSGFFLACDSVSRFFSISQCVLPCRNGTTSSAGSADAPLRTRPATRGASCARLPAPSSGSRPYQRSRMAILCGCFLSLLWYKPRLTLSRYTELVICESAATPGPLATAEGSAQWKGAVPGDDVSAALHQEHRQVLGKRLLPAVLTSSVATRTCAWSARSLRARAALPGRCPAPRSCLLQHVGARFSNKSDICTAKTALWSAVTHGELSGDAPHLIIGNTLSRE